MQELNYELCEQCEKNMQEALNELGKGAGMTIEEMIETEAQIPATFAIGLAQEGHIVRRVNDADHFTVQIAKDGLNAGKEDFCIVNAEGEQTGSYRLFTTEDLLAEDYIVVK